MAPPRNGVCSTNKEAHKHTYIVGAVLGGVLRFLETPYL
jgi:hypothetical protein